MLKLRIPKIKLYEPFLWTYYIWYYLPIARASFRSGLYKQLFFFVFILGCALCVFDVVSRYRRLELKYNALIPVLAYFLVFAFLVLLDIDTASRHIRISFTFWGTLGLFYLTTLFPEVQKRLATLFLVMFLITTVTSLVGVILNPSAARTLAYAGNAIEEDLSIRKLNIGGISFFQGLVLCVPILITFIYKRRHAVFSIILLVSILIGMFFASFTISLIMFFVALLLGYFANNSTLKKYMIVLMLLIVLIIVPWSEFFSYAASVISNQKISVRMQSISDALAMGKIDGNLQSRLQVYMISLETFLKNPFGIGAHYTYTITQNGIGYHSQIIDDLARYGLLALAFYIAFFFGYYQLLRKQWAKIHMSQIALPVVLLYVCFLILNLGFTSAHESVLMLFLIPVFPIFLCQETND